MPDARHQLWWGGLELVHHSGLLGMVQERAFTDWEAPWALGLEFVSALAEVGRLPELCGLGGQDP